jgi:Uma2 family endonuclease
MRRKLQEYFDAGCRMVWYLYPEDRAVHVYTSPDECSIVAEDGVLDGSPVLPGFSVPVQEWLKRARVRKGDSL